MELKEFILEHFKRWPSLKINDLVKALYQSEFGCGHLITDSEKGLNWLKNELESCAMPENGVSLPLVEPLFGNFVRVHLQKLKESGVSAKTLFKLFELSANEPVGDMDAFNEKLATLEDMVNDGALPFSKAETKDFLDKYRAAGCPAMHHSDAFNAAYHAAYRVIRKDFAIYLDVFAAIDRAILENRPFTLAIEGGSASGKSTLGELVSKVYDCNLFHMDDFFLQPHQRTPERFAQPGGNVDRERFLEEVLVPMKSGKSFSYKPFDCSVMEISQNPVSVMPKQLNVIEGAYSMHPDLQPFYDFSVCLKIDPQLQADRILYRNGPQMQQRFLNEWIPLEEVYFKHFDIRNKCDLLIDIK